MTLIGLEARPGQQATLSAEDPGRAAPGKHLLCVGVPAVWVPAPQAALVRQAAWEALPLCTYLAVTPLLKWGECSGPRDAVQASCRDGSCSSDYLF